MFLYSSYQGKSARHLVTRVKEHWASKRTTGKSAVKEHILDCNNCVKSDDILKSFSILRKYTSDYDTKIHEALLIKKYKPKLKQAAIWKRLFVLVKNILIDSVVFDRSLVICFDSSLKIAHNCCLNIYCDNFKKPFRPLFQRLTALIISSVRVY